MKSLRILSLSFCLMIIMALASCSGSQDGKLIGTWELTPMDALPEEFPKIYWEFTSDNDILRYEVTDLEQNLLSVGRWGFSKRNRLNISKFDQDFNGEWEIVTFKQDVLRMVLKVFNENDQPAGQVLVEFTRVNNVNS
jgi:hypothetical protein